MDKERPTNNFMQHKKTVRVLDFPGGLVVKSLACNARDSGSIPGQGTKIPHAAEQLRLGHNYWSPQAKTKEPRWKIPQDSVKVPRAATKTWYSCWLQRTVTTWKYRVIYLVGKFRPLSLGDSISVALRKLLHGGRRGSQATKRAGSLNIKDGVSS